MIFRIGIVGDRENEKFEIFTNFMDIVYVPNAVMEEIEYKDDKVKYIIQKSTFIQVKKLSNKIPDNILNSNLEIEAISLALETNLSLIIDEKLGRKQRY